MARASDGTDVPVSPVPASSSNMGSPNGSLPDFEGTVYRASTMEEKMNECSYRLRSCRYSCRAYPDSEIASKRFPRQWPRMMRKSRILNKWLAALQPVLPHWKRMQRPSPVDRARQDLGMYSDTAMAPQPLGPSSPMAQGRLMTIELLDEDLIRSQAPKMNNHEVPFYYGSFANKTTLELRSGSILFGKGPIYQPTTNLSEYIATQVPCLLGSFLNHEPNVRTLWTDFKRMVSFTKLTVPSAAPIQQSLSVNPNQLKIERLENNLHLCGESWLTNLKFPFLMKGRRCIHPCARHTLRCPQHQRSKKWNWKTSVQSCSSWKWANIYPRCT